MTNNNTLPLWALRIQELTEKSGLAQAELARRAGMTRDSYNRYHSGRTRPPPDRLHALARVFAVHPNDIDPDQLTLEKRPAEASAEPYRVGRPANGDPDFVHLTLNVDLHISAMEQILRIVTKELQRQEK